MILLNTLVTATCTGRRMPNFPKPVESGRWIVPASEENALPYWGHKDGLRIGISPHLGPRGLISIYAPYLGHNDHRLLNFIAMEPVVNGRRGFSEMEHSGLDNVRGKRFWSQNELDRNAEPREISHPASGVVAQVDGHEELSVYIYSEPLDNGAKPIVQVVFRSDRPHEVGLRTYSATGSAKIDFLILSATMGNYARLRNIYLKDKVLNVADIYSDLPPDWKGFAPHRQWLLEDLIKIGDEVIVPANSDEEDPAAVEYDENVPPWWRYEGKPATQYWRKENPSERFLTRVNCRKTYFLHPDAPIPNGISFENFEVEQPFLEGDDLWFGVTPESPEEFCSHAKAQSRKE